MITADQKYKIAFMGTPDFAVPALKTLFESGYDIVAVYCQKPRPKDRGHKVQPCPVQIFAEEKGIPVFCPTSFRKEPDAVTHFQSLNLDFAIVAAYGLILPKSILEAPRFGCLNIHGSLLPRWRGAAPIHRALLAGDPVTGITIMQMDEGLDTGDMLLKDEVPITDHSTTAELHDSLAQMGADLILKSLQNHAKGDWHPIKQNDSESNYAPKLEKSEGQLSFEMSADQIDRCVRALNPWPGAYLPYKGDMIKVLETHKVKEAENEKPGILLSSERLVLSTQKDAIELISVQKPGRSKISGADFIRGERLTRGDSFLSRGSA